MLKSQNRNLSFKIWQNEKSIFSPQKKFCEWTSSTSVKQLQNYFLVNFKVLTFIPRFLIIAWTKKNDQEIASQDRLWWEILWRIKIVRFHILLLSINKHNPLLIDEVTIRICTVLPMLLKRSNNFYITNYYHATPRQCMILILSCSSQPHTAVFVLCSLWKWTWLNESSPQ